MKTAKERIDSLIPLLAMEFVCAKDNTVSLQTFSERHNVGKGTFNSYTCKSSEFEGIPGIGVKYIGDSVDSETIENAILEGRKNSNIYFAKDPKVDNEEKDILSIINRVEAKLDKFIEEFSYFANS